MTISAEMVEEIVVDAVRAQIADVEARASAESNVREVEAALERAQTDLEAAIRVLTDFADEAATRDRLMTLRAARDDAQGASRPARRHAGRCHGQRSDGLESPHA